MVEITSEEQNKIKRMKRTEDSLRELWENIKCANIQIIGIPEEEEKKKGYEKIFEEITVENFPNMEKEIVNQVQEAQRVPYRINPRRNMPSHILNKLRLKTKKKIKSSKGEATSNIQGKPHRFDSLTLTADLSAETLQVIGNGRVYLKCLKATIYNEDYLTWQGSHSKLMEKSKAFQIS